MRHLVEDDVNNVYEEYFGRKYMEHIFIYTLTFFHCLVNYECVNAFINVVCTKNDVLSLLVTLKGKYYKELLANNMFDVQFYTY